MLRTSISVTTVYELFYHVNECVKTFVGVRQGLSKFLLFLGQFFLELCGLVNKIEHPHKCALKAIHSLVRLVHILSEYLLLLDYELHHFLNFIVGHKSNTSAFTALFDARMDDFDLLIVIQMLG